MVDVLHVPRALGGLMARQGLSAISNARSAVDAVGAAVAERAELMRLLVHDDRPDLAHGSLTVLSQADSLALQRTHRVGRFSYVARSGVPDVVPVNYALDGKDVLIRSGPGPKLQAAERRDVVAFEVDEIDEDGHRGWSVVVHGTAVSVPPGEMRQLSTDALPWASGPRTHVIRIKTSRITGRRLD
jgi:hypothetical protein